MVKWNDGKTTEQVMHQTVRNHLIRCHRSVRQEYPDVAHMSPKDAADHLLHLCDSGQIRIKLNFTDSTSPSCRIIDVQAEAKTRERRRRRPKTPSVKQLSLFDERDG